MTVILDNHDFFYAAAPKVACTSIKNALFRAENNFSFEPFSANGRFVHIHNGAYPTLLYRDWPFSRINEYHKVTFVRDPVKRFLSAYSNRVGHHKELSVEKAGQKLEELHLQPSPSLSEFVSNFDKYIRAHPSINHHTQPLIDFLGSDPSVYAKIYNLGTIGEFIEDFRDLTGIQIEIGREQTSGWKYSPDDLTQEEIDKIKVFYEEDYELYGQYLD